MDLQKELKEFAKWLDGSDIKRPIEKMADHYWQEFKVQGISSNAVLNEVGGVVTLEQILSEEKFRKMTIEELDEIINVKLNFDDYKKLDGGWSKEKAEIIQAQREIIQGYYNRIMMRQPDLETIIQWIEDDLQTIRMDDVVLDAENIINASKDPSVSDRFLSDLNFIIDNMGYDLVKDKVSKEAQTEYLKRLKMMRDELRQNYR